MSRSPKKTIRKNIFITFWKNLDKVKNRSKNWRALGHRHLEAGEGLGVLDDESEGRDDLVGRADEGQIIADGDALSARLADRVDVELGKAIQKNTGRFSARCAGDMSSRMQKEGAMSITLIFRYL
jgi:hypothetical protein